METEREEIIDYLVGEYGEIASEAINVAISEAKEDEELELYMSKHNMK